MEINFINEILSFERWLETHYLSANAQLLWYKLFLLSNKCGFCEYIQVDNQRLMSYLHISREQSLVDIRSQLIQAGLIKYTKGKKGSPSKYHICTFKNEVYSVPQNVGKNVAQSEGYKGGQSETIYKEKEKYKNIYSARAKKNKFNNFQQRDYENNQELEHTLIANCN